MNRAENKSARLIQIENLLLAHPEGLTQAEVARKLQVDRSTIHRDLADLPGHIYQEDDGRLKIDRSADLINVHLNLHEALAVHVAARLLATRMDRQNRHAAAALRKLGLAMERWARRISTHVLQSADVMDDSAQRDDPVYLDVLEKLTEAWANGRKVHIWHQGDRGEKVLEYLLCPYFIEPYAVGQTTHVIGLSQMLREGGASTPEKIRTFKIERIRRAEVTRDPYEIPADFDPRRLLADAWGIWYTEGEPVEVTLKFGPNVARRVRETQWHSSEQEEAQPDGSILWRAQIAEPKEMIPWIRGWGADCEVLAPEGLRKALEREARKMARLYGVAGEDVNVFYAHTRKDADKSEWQKLLVHLDGTAQKAAEMGKDAGIAELARIAGQIHDLGKYSLEFQRRLDGDKRRVDHATAGAQEIWKLYGQTHKWPALMLAYAISGHHGGLPDYGSLTDVGGEGTLLARLDPQKTKLKDYSAYKSELDLSALTMPALALKRTQNPGFSCSFLTRMLFSTLVDADWLDTETFCEGERPRGGYDSIETLRAKLSAHLRQFENPTTDINRKRTETLNACRAKADSPQGIFTLTLPTGGGKTLASMAFALNHAAQHGLKRVIYVIPFTSIIEQNAEVFKDCLGAENVLEHHSNFDWEQVKRRASAEGQDDETNIAEEKLKLAAENWDIPIVVTTNVQFFESLFASKKSRCRKLHNLAKSVIIFDEAQTLPREFMQPCMLAVQELVLNYGVSAVFCTATQPILKQFMPDMPEFAELVSNRQELFDFYKRVTVQQAGTLTDPEVLSRINGLNQALCIVNTRRHAKGLFDGLTGDGKFHLSTLMCPAHRKEVLREVRERLKSGQTCRVVSTQVMEAGIDVDFPVGFRALAGLDSIIQAAGRVNREGKNPNGDMFVFEPKTEFIKRTPTFIAQTGEAARNVLREFGADPTTRQAIEAYFNLLLVLSDKKAFDAKEILADLNRTDGFDFKTAAEKFKLIENNTVAVIIPYDDEVWKLIDRLAFTPYPTTILRKLQPYTVNIYEREFEDLNAQGAIEMAADAYAVLKGMSFYSQETGIILPASEGGAAIFFD